MYLQKEWVFKYQAKACKLNQIKQKNGIKKEKIDLIFFVKKYSLHIFVYLTMSQSTKFNKTNLFYVTLQHT
jgi:hypothetical protein